MPGISFFSMKQLSCRLRLSISSDSHFQRPLHSPSRLANPHSSLQPPIYLLHRNLHLSPKSQGIPGNEKVDATAKAVTSLPRIHSRILPTKADLSLIIRRHIIDHWIALWQNRVPSNKLVQIKPSPFVWQSSHLAFRWQEIWLTRFRIGHTRLTHAYLLS